MKKIILTIIDGMGDRPIPELGNKTPLEAASSPNLDFLAQEGVCGLVLPFLFPGEEVPTSQGAHIALLGYKDYFLGRGPYEAAGIEMKMEPGDVALRANFGTVDEDLKIIDRRAGRIEKTSPLIEALSGIEIKGVKFLIKRSYGHRAVLILRGQNLSDKITDGDPHKTGVKVKKIKPQNQSRSAQFTAQVLNQFLEKAHQILKNHPFNKKREKQDLLPGNYLLVRGAGCFKEVPSFKERYDLRSCCIAGGGLYRGVGKILGMDLIKVKGDTGQADTNLKGKISAAKRNLREYNFVFLHIKATDTFSHDGDFVGKKEFIEKIDKNLKPLLGLKDTLLVITADHSSCSKLKDHCKEPIPLLVWGDGKDSVSQFSEKSCPKGKLGKIKQIHLMGKILELAQD